MSWEIATGSSTAAANSTGGGYWKEQLRETETRKYEIYSCCRCKRGHLTHFKPPRLPHESSRRPSDNRAIGAVGAIGHAGRSN